MTVPAPPKADPRQTRHSMALVRRAQELCDAGWTYPQAARVLAKEFDLDRVPSTTTLRCWLEPGYRERHRSWQRKCYSGEPSTDVVTPALLRALRVEDGLSYMAITKVLARFCGEDLSEFQVRSRLYEIGIEKNPNKVRAATKVAA